jgi:hypothetical protein
MADTHSKCRRCGGIVPVPPRELAPPHRDHSRNEDCTGEGKPTKRM